MVNTDFIFFVDTRDDLLYLKDVTDYPIMFNQQELIRSDFGIVFAYTFTDFETGSITVDLSDFYDITSISSSMGGLARVKVFIVANHDINYTYEIGDVVFYNNLFYKSLSGSNTDLPTAITWEVLTEATAYDILVTAFEGDNLYTSLDLICEVPYIPYYSIIRTGNYDYELRNNFEGTITTVSTKLYTYEDKLVWEFDETFTLTEDGVYKIVVECTYNGMDETFVLILDNFYAFEVCARKLIEKLLCVGEGCGDTALVKQKINEFSNVFFAIYMNINVNKVKFYGLLEEGTEKEEFIQEVGLLAKKAKMLVESCNSCSDD